MASDDGLRERREESRSHSIADGCPIAYIFVKENQNQIGLRAVIYNLSGEAGISISISY